MSHFTTRIVYNILPCKQLNSLSQELKSKHSDKVNSFKEPERQAVTKASSCLLSEECIPKPFYNAAFSEIPDPVAAYHHLFSNPNICLKVGNVVEGQPDQAPQNCRPHNQSELPSSSDYN